MQKLTCRELFSALVVRSYRYERVINVWNATHQMLWLLVHFISRCVSLDESADEVKQSDVGSAVVGFGVGAETVASGASVGASVGASGCLVGAGVGADVGGA